jgi:hypothetical protein
MEWTQLMQYCWFGQSESRGKEGVQKKDGLKGFKLSAQQSNFSQNAEDQIRRHAYSLC